MEFIYTGHAIAIDVAMVGESIQTRARTSLVALFKIRRLKLMLAVDYTKGQRRLIMVTPATPPITKAEISCLRTLDRVGQGIKEKPLLLDIQKRLVKLLGGWGAASRQLGEVIRSWERPRQASQRGNAEGQVASGTKDLHRQGLGWCC